MTCPGDVRRTIPRMRTSLVLERDCGGALSVVRAVDDQPQRRHEAGVRGVCAGRGGGPRGARSASSGEGGEQEQASVRFMGAESYSPARGVLAPARGQRHAPRHGEQDRPMIPSDPITTSGICQPQLG